MGVPSGVVTTVALSEQSSGTPAACYKRGGLPERRVPLTDCPMRRAASVWRIHVGLGEPGVREMDSCTLTPKPLALP